MISVVIATYGRPAQLRRALESLLAGSALPAEIVIVDQSDDDATRAVTESFATAAIRYMHQAPPSVATARNRAIEAARGEYAAIVDDDCEVPRDWLESVGRELERHSFPDALYGAILPPPDETHPDDLPVSIFEPPAAREWDARAHPGYVGYSAHLILKRSTFLALGGFDPRLGPGSRFNGAEDIDLSYRLLRDGYRAVSTPAISVVHRQPRTRGDLPRYFYVRNRAQAAFCAKHARAGDRRVLGVLAEQARSDARMLASAVRRRSWLRARTAARRAAGTCAGAVAGWRAFAGEPR